MADEATWATPDDVVAALGGEVAADDDYLFDCVDASNSYCFRRRREAGYVDDPWAAPNPAARTATVLYAVALWRERGAVDSYASFQDLGNPLVPTGSMGQIHRLLGVNRAQVDMPLPLVPVVIEETPPDAYTTPPPPATTVTLRVPR